MTRTDPRSQFGSLFSTMATLTSPVQGMLSRPFYDAVPQLVVRAQRPWLSRTLELMHAWQERARQRRQLMRFDDHLLRDIGVTRAEAATEAEKPFWRA